MRSCRFQYATLYTLSVSTSTSGPNEITQLKASCSCWRDSCPVKAPGTLTISRQVARKRCAAGPLRTPMMPAFRMPADRDLTQTRSLGRRRPERERRHEVGAHDEVVIREPLDQRRHRSEHQDVGVEEDDCSESSAVDQVLEQVRLGCCADLEAAVLEGQEREAGSHHLTTEADLGTVDLDVDVGRPRRRRPPAPPAPRAGGGRGTIGLRCGRAEGSCACTPSPRRGRPSRHRRARPAVRSGAAPHRCAAAAVVGRSLVGLRPAQAYGCRSVRHTPAPTRTIASIVPIGAHDRRA